MNLRKTRNQQHCKDRSIKGRVKNYNNTVIHTSKLRCDGDNAKYCVVTHILKHPNRLNPLTIIGTYITESFTGFIKPAFGFLPMS